MKTINASELKAKCLAILDEVAATGDVVTILKRGRPIARLVPPVPATGPYPQHDLLGTVEFLGDVVAPVVEAADWEVLGSP